MGLGEPYGRDAEEPIGADRRQQVSRCRTWSGSRVDLDRVGREPVGRRRHTQDVLVDKVDCAAWHHEQALFLAVCAEQQVNFAARSGGDAVDGHCGKEVAVDHRLERHQIRGDLAPFDGVGHRECLGTEHHLGLIDFCHRRLSDRGTVRRHAELLGQVAADPGCGCRRQGVVSGPALGDRALEQTLGARHRKERPDTHCAGRLAEDRDVVFVPTERSDVVPHPLQRRDLVEQTEVGDSVV